MNLDYSPQEISLAAISIIITFCFCAWVAVHYRVNFKKLMCNCFVLTSVCLFILWAQSVVDSLYPDNTMRYIGKCALISCDICLSFLLMSSRGAIDRNANILLSIPLVTQLVVLAYLGNVGAMKDREISIAKDSGLIQGNADVIEEYRSRIESIKEDIALQRPRLKVLTKEEYITSSGAEKIATKIEVLETKRDILTSEMTALKVENNKLIAKQPSTIKERYGESGSLLLDLMGYLMTLTFFILSIAFGVCAKRFDNPDAGLGRMEPSEPDQTNDTDHSEPQSRTEPNHAGEPPVKKSLANKLAKSQAKLDKAVKKKEIDNKYKQGATDNEIKTVLVSNGINSRRPAIEMKNKMGWDRSNEQMRLIVNSMKSEEVHQGTYIPEGAR